MYTNFCFYFFLHVTKVVERFVGEGAKTKTKEEGLPQTEIYKEERKI